MVAKINYEAELQNQLDFAGYKYYREYPFHPHRKWRCDFYLHEHNLIVEVEGIQYRGAGRHQRGVGFQGDCEKYNELTLHGYRLFRFTPAQITGKAKRNDKARTLMAKAIDVIDILCLGLAYPTIDRSLAGYASLDK